MTRQITVVMRLNYLLLLNHLFYQCLSQLVLMRVGKPKKNPPTTFVDITAMHGNFCTKFYTVVKRSNIHFITKFY